MSELLRAYEQIGINIIGHYNLIYDIQLRLPIQFSNVFFRMSFKISNAPFIILFQVGLDIFDK